MRPQFPGMDPWLEHPDLWPDVHNSLITAIRDELMPKVLPRYVVRVESRTTVLTGLDVDRPVSTRLRGSSCQPVRSWQWIAEWRSLSEPQARHFEVIVPLIEEDEIEETFLTIQELPGRKLVTASRFCLRRTRRRRTHGRNTWKSGGT